MNTSTTYVPLPQPYELSEREKEDAMGAYFMMFASLAAGLPFPVLNLIAAIIYYYINKKESRFVQFHAFQSLISQIAPSLLNAIAIIWSVVNLLSASSFWTPLYSGFLVVTILTNLIYFIISIIAATKARKGKMYYFISFGRLAYWHTFRKKEKSGSEKAVNQPPG